MIDIYIAIVNTSAIYFYKHSLVNRNSGFLLHTFICLHKYNVMNNCLCIMPEFAVEIKCERNSGCFFFSTYLVNLY